MDRTSNPVISFHKLDDTHFDNLLPCNVQQPIGQCDNVRAGTIGALEISNKCKGEQHVETLTGSEIQANRSAQEMIRAIHWRSQACTTTTSF